jgi:hypothetical protein
LPAAPRASSASAGLGVVIIGGSAAIAAGPSSRCRGQTGFVGGRRLLEPTVASDRESPSSCPASGSVSAGARGPVDLPLEALPLPPPVLSLGSVPGV